MDITNLSDSALIESLSELARRGQRWVVVVLRHLAEVDRRELHLARGYSALYKYCMVELGFDRFPAVDRASAAQLGRQIPHLFDRIESGQLTLTAVRTLKSQLERDLKHNHRAVAELLDAAAHKTVDEIKRLLVERHPKPEVGPSIRKVKTPKPAGPPQPARPLPLFDKAATRPPKPEPIAKDRFKVAFTGSGEFVGMLDETNAMLSQATGRKCGLEEVIETAVRELRAKLLKKKFALGARPIKATAKKEAKSESSTTTGGTGKRSRRIPNAVRRRVAQRDGLQCAYRDEVTGRRCDERRWLEYQHHVPFSQGGEHTVDNLSLFCRAHNQWAGRRDGLIPPRGQVPLWEK